MTGYDKRPGLFVRPREQHHRRGQTGAQRSKERREVGGDGRQRVAVRLMRNEDGVRHVHGQRFRHAGQRKRPDNGNESGNIPDYGANLLRFVLTRIFLNLDRRERNAGSDRIHANRHLSGQGDAQRVLGMIPERLRPRHRDLIRMNHRGVSQEELGSRFPIGFQDRLTCEKPRFPYYPSSSNPRKWQLRTPYPHRRLPRPRTSDDRLRSPTYRLRNRLRPRRTLSTPTRRSSTQRIPRERTSRTLSNR